MIIVILIIGTRSTRWSKTSPCARWSWRRSAKPSQVSPNIFLVW